MNNLIKVFNKLIYGPQNIDIHRHDIANDCSYISIGSSLDPCE